MNGFLVRQTQKTFTVEADKSFGRFSLLQETDPMRGPTLHVTMESQAS